MKLTLAAHRLRHELGIRGITATELARLAGVSCPTVTSALAGRALTMRSAMAIASALRSRPILSELENLIPLTQLAEVGRDPSYLGTEYKNTQRVGSPERSDISFDIS